MLVGSHVKPNSIRSQDANKISEESNETLRASRLRAGDLVTVRVGEPGITAVIPPELNNCNCASMMIVRQSDRFDSEWLCATMNSRIGISQIEHVQYGTAQKQFNISDAVDFLYPFPPPSEQTAIANALSDVDNLITSLEKLIAKKRAIKTATMQQLLTGKTRLPGFDKHPNGKPKGMQQTELGEIPEDWDLKPFAEIVTLMNKRINPKIKGGGDLCIELEHVEQRVGRLNGSIRTTSHSSLKNAFSEEDVLFGKLRSYLRKYWVADMCGVCSTEFWVLRANSDAATSQFVFQTVQTEKFIECTTESYGTHMPRSDWKVVRSFLVATPNVVEQTAIADVLSNMDKELDALTQRLNKTQQIKQGMMQELLTGRTRLV